jgi:putative phosphoesterase
MKIGILSDTHNNLTNLQAALNAFRAESIHTLIHCGDLTAPETAASLGGFRVIHVLGNGDYLSGEIHRILLELNPLNSSGLSFNGEIDGIPGSPARIATAARSST